MITIHDYNIITKLLEFTYSIVICDFSIIKLDSWLTLVFMERGGGLNKFAEFKSSLSSLCIYYCLFSIGSFPIIPHESYALKFHNNYKKNVQYLPTQF